MSNKTSITKDSRLSDWVGIIPLSSLISLAVLAFLIYSFFSGSLLSFYASALFSFYAITGKMWISVIMLGIFQTLVLIPLRIIKVIRSNNITEFQRKIEEKDDSETKVESMQTNFKGGNRTFLFYLVDFGIQLATFLTIGRLFLTDFYSKALNPSLLYDFVPYPEYPIQDTIFKIPYVNITETMDLGLKAIGIFWLVILLFQLIVWLVRKILSKYRERQVQEKIRTSGKKYTFGYMLILFVISIYLMRNFPVGFELAIFTGDVTIPNRTLNTVTAVATFLTLLWFGMQRIRFKTSKAQKEEVPQNIIDETQKDMFKNTVFSATLVGLGAFFITNHIPSAFELSVFTLEIISFFSPFTLDKIIRGARDKIKGQQTTVPA